MYSRIDTTVYVVINEGRAVYVSLDEGDAESYAYKEEILDRDEALEEMGIADDPTRGELADAGFFAGVKAGIYEIYDINLMNYKQDEEICLGSHEVNYNDIIELLGDQIDSITKPESVTNLENATLVQDFY